MSHDDPDNVTPFPGGGKGKTPQKAKTYNWELERLCVGAALLDPALLDDANLRPHHFHRAPLAMLWQFMRDLRLQTAAGCSEPVDPSAWLVTVLDRRQAGGRTDLPPVSEIAQLPMACPSTEAFRDAEERVIEYAHAREVLFACESVKGRLAAGDSPVEIISSFATMVERLGCIDPVTRQGWSRYGDVAAQVAMEAVEPVATTRIATGLGPLDDLLGGLRESDLVILGARTSMGKTALALQIAIHVATVGRAVGIFSMEMARDAMAMRGLARESGVPIQEIRSGGLEGHAAREIREASRIYADLPLWIDDGVGLSVDAMAARARRLATLAGQPVGLLVVDYLQLAKAPVGRGESRERVVAEVSMGLKAIARANRCTVLALAQLNREAAKRTDNRPTLTDLRDSGQIEQDADVVALLHRAPHYEPDHPDPGEAEIIVAKQRQGPTGVVRLRFDGREQRFSPDPAASRAPSRPDTRRRAGGDYE